VINIVDGAVVQTTPTQSAYTITNPAFFPQAGVPIPRSACSRPKAPRVRSLGHLSHRLQPARTDPVTVGHRFDRQLPKNTTLSVNYINSRGTHILRTVDINTPLPGTFNPLNPAAPGILTAQPPEFYEALRDRGIYKQSQLIFI